jgi:RHS repeat-associated protein
MFTAFFAVFFGWFSVYTAQVHACNGEFVVPTFPEDDIPDSEDPGDDGDDDCGGESGGHPESGEPVALYDGRKFHRFTPLNVATSGDDFSLRFMWGSRKGGIPGGEYYRDDVRGYLGDGWLLSCIPQLNYAIPDGGAPTDPGVLKLVDNPKSVSAWYQNGTISSATIWTTGGPSSKYFRMGATNSHVQFPSALTFALVDAGRSIKHFYRTVVLPDGEYEKDFLIDPSGAIITPPDSLRGLLAQEIDSFGNRRDYVYERMTDIDIAPRLKRIYCVNVAGDLEAVIEFEWVYLDPDPEDLPCFDVVDHPLHGKLRRIKVLRPDGSCIPEDFDSCGNVETDRIELVYFDDLHAPTIGEEPGCAVTVSPGNWLGGPADLVQVGVYERIDRKEGSIPDEGDPTSGSYAWHEDVPYDHKVDFYQFRYYSNTDDGERDYNLCADAPETLGAGPAGISNYLRVVVLPEQLEYFAQERSQASLAGSGPRLTRFDTAVYLLGRDTSLGVAGAQAQLIADLAAKVIVYELVEIGGALVWRVERQYLSAAGCGCGGGAGTYLSRRLTYSRIEDYPVPAASTWGYRQTVIIEDATKPVGASSFAVERSRVYDLATYGPGGTPYLINKVIAEGTIAPGETRTQGLMDEGERVWVTHYAYDDADRMRRRVMTASALSSYTMGEANPSMALEDDHVPEYVPNASGGLVYGYAYTTSASPGGENRSALVGVREGAGSGAGDFGVGAADSTLTKVQEIEYGVTSSTGRVHLPIRLDRFRTTSGSGADDIERTTFTYGFRASFEAPDALAYVQREVERELESENGPSGSTTVSDFELYTTDGLNIYSVDMTGAITSRTFQDQTGLAVSIVENANVTVSSGAYAGVDTSGWNRNLSGSLDLTTTIRRDRLGRITQEERPGSTPVYTVREMRDLAARPGLSYFAHVDLPAIADANGAGTSDDEYGGPAVVEWTNADGKSIGRDDFSMGSAGYTPTTPSSTGYQASVSAYDLDTLLSKSRTTHDVSGNARWAEMWHDVSGDALNDQRLVERWFYDPLGRTIATVAANGTYSLFDYDALDRVTAELTGVTSHTTEPAFTDTAPTSGTALRDIYYDLDPSSTPGATNLRAGNGAVSHIVEHVATSATRVTRRLHDYRDRTIGVFNPEQPHQAARYDNLSRITDRVLLSDLATVSDLASEIPTVFDATTVTLVPDGFARGLVERVAYSQRGLPFERKLAINPEDLGDGYLQWNMWRDGEGRVLAERGPNQPKRVFVIDGLGRMPRAYVSDGKDDPAPGASGNFASATSVTDDRVVEQVEYDFHPSRQTSRVKSLLRAHDADADYTTPGVQTLTGPLSAADDRASVVSWLGYQFDEAARVVKEIDFGTNNLTTDVFSSGASDPTASSPDADALITETVYDERGLVQYVEDPEGKKTRFFYDDLPRRVATVENWVNASVARSSTPDQWKWTLSLGSQSGLDEDRATLSYHDVAENTSFLVAAHSNGGVSTPTSTTVTEQVTTYTYKARTTDATLGTTSTLVDSNDLLSQVIYPDSSGSSDGVSYRYNRLGELTALSDQNGTIHEYDRDDLGRVTEDAVTTLGANLNGALRRIEVAYDAMGRRDAVRSFDAATGGDVRNAVGFAYNGLWQVAAVKQNPLGDVNEGDDPTVMGFTFIIHELWTQYEYDTQKLADGNRSRLDDLLYPTDPGGSATRTALAMNYGVSTDLDSMIHRPRGFGWEYATTDRSLRQDYVGLSLAVRKDMNLEGGSVPIPEIRLDRFSDPDNGARTSGTYHALDRFGRVKGQLWVWPEDIDDPPAGENFEWVATSRPAIVDLRYSYDMSSNVLDRLDRRAGGRVGLTAPDELYSYDGLDRLSQADRGKRDVSTGVWASQGVSNAGTPSQQWALDPVGNWQRTLTDTSGNGSFTANSDFTDRRNANAVNEIKGGAFDQQVESSTITTPLDLDYTYDPAGNMTGRDKLVPGSPATAAGWTYVYDAWNRLVTVKDGADDVRAHYAYNGLHQRTARIADSDPSDVDAFVDEANLYYYDAGWRLLEEQVDDALFESSEDQPSESDPFASLEPIDSVAVFVADRITHRIWGMEYIDELLFTMTDDSDGVSGGPEGDFTTGDPDGFYAVVDRLYSVVALLDEQADLLERVRYSAYGLAKQHSVTLGDINGDGVTNFADLTSVNTAFGKYLANPSDVYSADADFDGNGVVNFGDQSRVLSNFGMPGAPAGQISQHGNTIGYAGYLFDPATEMALARFRWYDPEQGRWVNRDPITYFDGMSMYEYVGSTPLGDIDSFGLAGTGSIHPGTPILELIATWSATMTNAEIAAALVYAGIGVAILDGTGNDDIAEIMRRMQRQFDDAFDGFRDRAMDQFGRELREQLARALSRATREALCRAAKKAKQDNCKSRSKTRCDSMNTGAGANCAPIRTNMRKNAACAASRSTELAYCNWTANWRQSVQQVIDGHQKAVDNAWDAANKCMKKLSECLKNNPHQKRPSDSFVPTFGGASQCAR